MAFKSIVDYDADKYKGLFRLPNDGDSAEVIFLYEKITDAQIGPMHYISCGAYTGLVHCLESADCPACAFQLKVQEKLLVPLYNISAGEPQFFNRGSLFKEQLVRDVFNRYPNPTEYKFRITRHGAAGDRDTKYSISVLDYNDGPKYADIMAKYNIKFPEYYENIVRSVDAQTMRLWLDSSGTRNTTATYNATPRVSIPPIPVSIIDTTPEMPSVQDDDVPFSSSVVVGKDEDTTEVVSYAVSTEPTVEMVDDDEVSF